MSVTISLSVLGIFRRLVSLVVAIRLISSAPAAASATNNGKRAPASGAKANKETRAAIHSLALMGALCFL
jgi:hypothetical protein